MSSAHSSVLNVFHCPHISIRKLETLIGLRIRSNKIIIFALGSCPFHIVAKDNNEHWCRALSTSQPRVTHVDDFPQGHAPSTETLFRNGDEGESESVDEESQEAEGPEGTFFFFAFVVTLRYDIIIFFIVNGNGLSSLDLACYGRETYHTVGVNTSNVAKMSTWSVCSRTINTSSSWKGKEDKLHF